MNEKYTINIPDYLCEKMSKLEKQLYSVVRKINDMNRCRIRYTKRGVPTLIIDEFYSIVYFRCNRRFSAYSDLFNFEVEQKRYDFSTYLDVAEFVNKDH